MEKLRKPMLIACGGFVILFIFLFILSSCNKKQYTSEEFNAYLIKQAKEYYKLNNNALPQVDGGKTSLSISSIVEEQEKFMKDTTCSGSIDVFNNNGNYMYISNINCSDGYSSEKLSDHLISKGIVSTGNGLYQQNDYYIYRGDNVDNFIVFNDQVFRVVRINNDGTLKVIETDYIVKNKKDGSQYKSSRRTSSEWDNRYNSERNFSSGFNDYVHENINSRIKDTLENIYNEYSSDVKAYIVKQDLCIGKRSLTETDNSGMIECSNIMYEQFIGLLPLYEYINASLDASCVSAESSTCANYNYLATMKSTFWSMTAVSGNSYDVFKIGKKISDATANSTATPKVVLNLSSEIRFTNGDGTQENPYIID